MPGAKKPAGVKSTQNVSARELWLQAVKARSARMGSGTKKGMSTTKKTPSEYWIGTLRRSQGLQGEIASMDTFGNGRPADSSKPYLSTSHYLRERAGVESPGRAQRNGVDMRVASGTPAYKTPEEYYDEVLELRKQISFLDKDNSTIKAKLRRVEEDNLKKEKEIQSLLDPNTSGDIRRTLTDRKPDSSAVVHSMKQKLLKLEQQLRDKENALSNLKNDVKYTNLEEIRLKMEMFYQEINRLQTSRAAPQQVGAKSSGSAKNGKESTSKIKALNETILRMNQKNVKLTEENKTLREDMEKLINELSDKKEKQRDYEDMNKRQLTGVIAKLEKRLEQQLPLETSSQISDAGNKAQRTNTDGKMELGGSLAERLEQLDNRESELLAEITRLKGSMKKLKEDRVHYRQKCDDKNKEIKRLNREILDLQAELDTFYDKDLHSSRRPSSIHDQADRIDDRSPSARRSARDRPPSARDRPSSARDPPVSARERRTSANRGLSRQEFNERKDRRLLEIRENQAARTIQRGWRQSHLRNEEEEYERDRARKVEEFSQNRAAKKIQNHWNIHKKTQREAEYDDAITLVQSATRGNVARRKQLQQYEDDDELSDAAEIIQSSYRGHQGRKTLLRQSSRASSIDRASEDEDWDAAVTSIQSTYRGHAARKQTLASTSSRPPSARSTSSRARSSPTTPRRQQQLDSAGEEENISDETVTPRGSRMQRKSSSSSLRRATPISRKPPSSPRGSRAAIGTADSYDDDDDIEM